MVSTNFHPLDYSGSNQVSPNCNTPDSTPHPAVVTHARSFIMDSRGLLAFLMLATLVALSYGAGELQPDDVDSGKYDHMTHKNPTLCTRKCRVGEPPRVCYYKFHMEPYVVLGGACGLCPTVQDDCYKPQCVTADGVEKAILTVNRRLPGPSIQVCKGDTIIVDMKNQMPGISTTIHWHGNRQRLTPWADGVPMVTQCPTLEGQTFRYRFLADESGTYFWHSHDGLQKVDGIVGSLVVRQPKIEDPVAKFYDYDLPSHVVIVQDWMHTPANERMPGYMRTLTEMGQGPNTYLINGKGVNVRTLYDLYGPLKSPMSVFRVKKGFRYRFRIIGGTCLACPFRITFQDHRPLVISIDDNPIVPVTVDSLVISAGERYDVVIKAEHFPASYWITVRGLGTCATASQAAVLQYEGSLTSKPTLPQWTALIGITSGVTLNPRNSKCTAATRAREICVSQLKSKVPTPRKLLKPKPDVTITMAFGFHTYSNQELFESNTYNRYFVPVITQQLVSLINNRSNDMPPSPLLTQYSDIPPSRFCSDQPCPNGWCQCTNVIKVPLGSVVEIIIADTTAPSIIPITHPFHIHGHDFFILEQGVFDRSLGTPFEVALAKLKARLAVDRVVPDFLPTKDTVTIPASGYAVVRVLADNPGFWLYHCHFTYHLAQGMSAIFQVGELSDMKRPPSNFPKCGQFLPNERLSLLPREGDIFPLDNTTLGSSNKDIVNIDKNSIIANVNRVTNSVANAIAQGNAQAAANIDTVNKHDVKGKPNNSVNGIKQTQGAQTGGVNENKPQNKPVPGPQSSSKPTSNKRPVKPTRPLKPKRPVKPNRPALPTNQNNKRPIANYPPVIYIGRNATVDEVNATSSINTTSIM